jgi:hypothetical protein
MVVDKGGYRVKIEEALDLLFKCGTNIEAPLEAEVLDVIGRYCMIVKYLMRAYKEKLTFGELYDYPLLTSLNERIEKLEKKLEEVK